MKSKYFADELSYFKNNDILEDAKTLIELLPNYFFEIEASSSGKYHPRYALGSGGLLRHTKVVVKIGNELLNNESIGEKYTTREKDLMLLAMIMHDGVKRGEDNKLHTVSEHPLLSAKLVDDNKDKLNIKENELELLLKCIKAHTGPWNKDYYGNEILPKPDDKYTKFVHMCDFLASKKFLNVEFINNNIVG